MNISAEAEKYIEFLKRTHGSETAGRLLAYVDLVLERNEHINLTAVRDRDEAIIKHLADSLAILDLPEFWDAETVIDVGTGAGFPGALLAIVCPRKSFVLLDSTRKRLRVIDEFAEELGIDNITTVHARAEEAGAQELKESFDICVSRAVADLSKLAGWTLPFVRRGGCAVAYKGENYRSELDSAKKDIKKYNGYFDRAVSVGGGYDEISGHVLLVIKKR